MNTEVLAKPFARLTGFEFFARKMVIKKLSSLKDIRIHVSDPVGNWTAGEISIEPLQLSVYDMQFYTHVLLAGTNGAANAYHEGYWDCSDLTRLFRGFLRNIDSSDRFDFGLASLGRWWLKRKHQKRANTHSGSKNNIHAHYDLGNEMFELFLDSTMTYSSAYFSNNDMTIEEASIEKLDKICQHLDIQPHHHIVEIGTGWGSFAIHAARNYKCKVTTTTISSEQYDLAKQRVKEAGLEDKIDILLTDYRDMDGKYDKLVSIEMIEAVGHKYLPTYFKKCASLLKPDGQMLIQAITMPDQRYDRYLKTSDFIQQYIFPGSCVPSFTAITNACTSGSDLKIRYVEDFGLDYAKTLNIWRKEFNNHIEDVRKLGYGEDFIRLWNYYLCYCDAGFLERYTGVSHILLNKPGYGVSG
jgi:cyclopropane-fatty-acyl-phospholipid synthase